MKTALVKGKPILADRYHESLGLPICPRCGREVKFLPARWTYGWKGPTFAHRNARECYPAGKAPASPTPTS